MSGNAIQTFLYFAYGSNLLAQRIHVLNPTAVRSGIGKLNDYRIDFDRFSSRWGGCSATIVADPGKYVWGALWEIDISQMQNLDDQEGVSENIYTPVQVNVTTSNNEVVNCRVYIMKKELPPYESPELLPKDRQPSRVYLETILQGAVESQLPQEYFHFLKAFPHNGYAGPVEVPGFNINFTHTSP